MRYTFMSLKAQPCPQHMRTWSMALATGSIVTSIYDGQIRANFYMNPGITCQSKVSEIRKKNNNCNVNLGRKRPDSKLAFWVFFHLLHLVVRALLITDWGLHLHKEMVKRWNLKDFWIFYDMWITSTKRIHYFLKRKLNQSYTHTHRYTPTNQPLDNQSATQN